MPHYTYTFKNRFAKIAPGAHAELIRRGWANGVKQNYDCHTGIVQFTWHTGDEPEHIGIEFNDGETVGFPPEFVVICGRYRMDAGIIYDTMKINPEIICRGDWDKARKFLPDIVNALNEYEDRCILAELQKNP